MKIKVSETTPIQLDWLVAKIEGVRHSSHASSVHYYSPTRVWSQGGPIIEEMLKSGVTTWNFLGDCFFELAEENILQKGSTPLIAGLRCYVASKLGDEVEIPEELS